MIGLCLTAERLEEASQESGREFASTELCGQTLASVMDLNCFGCCYFFSPLWKWTKLQSSVRHRPHLPPAVYAWNPISPSSQEAWRMAEGKRTLKRTHGVVHGIRWRKNSPFARECIILPFHRFQETEE